MADVEGVWYRGCTATGTVGAVAHGEGGGVIMGNEEREERPRKLRKVQTEGAVDRPLPADPLPLSRPPSRPTLNTPSRAVPCSPSPLLPCVLYSVHSLELPVIVSLDGDSVKMAKQSSPHR